MFQVLIVKLMDYFKLIYFDCIEQRKNYVFLAERRTIKPTEELNG